MIAIFRTKAQAASVVEPQASSRGRFVRNLETLDNARLFWTALPSHRRSVRRRGITSSASKPPLCAWQGLVVSPDDFLEHRFTEGEVCKQLFQVGVFCFDFFELSGLIDFETAVYLTPAVIGLFTDPGLFAGFRDGDAIYCLDVGLTLSWIALIRPPKIALIRPLEGAILSS